MAKIYFVMDDSGKIDAKNDYLFYGGFVFFNQEQMKNFIYTYQNYLEKIKNKYPHKEEVKSNFLKHNDRQKFIKMFSQNYSFAVLIDNTRLYEDIKKDAKSKGRFIDYAIKRLIKEVLKDCLKKNYLQKEKPIQIEILIDNQTIKSNGLYNLSLSIQKELTKGMKPLLEASYQPLFSKASVHVTYKDSKTSLLIQGADLLVGTVRRKVINDKEINFLDVFLKMP